ncbi:MAG: hypothetical protein R6W90_16410 [Ignavibacteriaceae bacterium]
METIYSHNITADELNKLGKMIPGREIDSESEYRDKISEEIKYADLFRLYSIRGKKEKAKLFLDKINDRVLKFLLQ